MAVVVTAIVAPELISATTTFLEGGSTAATALGSAVTAGTAAGATAAAATAAAAAASTIAAASLGGAVIGGAVAGAIGGIASPAFGVATGIQSKFDWSSVALAAIGGGVGGAVSSIPGLQINLGNASFSPSVNAALNAGANAVETNVLSQGIGVATGLQQKFDWTSVAVAGVGAAASAYASTSLARAGLSGPKLSFNNAANSALSGAAGSIVGAATRSLLTGTDFGDNIISDLPGLIGQTIGNLVASGIQQQQASEVQGKIDATLAAPATDAESQAAADAIAADPNSLQWGGKTLAPTDAQQIIIDRTRMDQLAQTQLGQTQAFQDKYAAFQDGLAANDAYNVTSNQTILGQYITRVTSGDYVQGLVTDDQASGYQGYLYHDSVGDRYVFADAGTQDATDRATDYALGGNKPVPQLTIARENALQLVANGVPNLTFTGHSLGGALAIIQGLTVGDRVVTFNTAPFTSTMASLYNVNLSNANQLVTNYRVSNDPLSMAEDNHALVTGVALALKSNPLIGPFLPPTLSENAWRLAPPPGKIITLPAAAPIAGAHFMVNVLNILAK